MHHFSISMELMTITKKTKHEHQQKCMRCFVRYNCECAYADYLSHESCFNDKQFYCQFQITCSIFEYILQTLASEDEYWRDGFDCTSRTKIKPEVKLLASLKVLSFGISFSAFCDYFQMGESSVREAVSRLACRVVENKKISHNF